MKLSLAFLLITMGGCTKQAPKPAAGGAFKSTDPPIVIVAALPPPKPRNYIAELRQLAKSNRRYWRIYCTDQEEADQAFQAELCTTRCEEALRFVEDGGRDWWAAQGATQADAAANLVNDYPNDVIHPVHRPTEKPHKHKQCPPELHGGPQ